MFYVLLRDLAERTRFIEHLKQRAIQSVFHYVPLHSSPAGRRLARAHGALERTDEMSERIVRLPLWLGLEPHQEQVIAAAYEFFA
jgi:dTDP-4-amino-4,6-dideoxygalactose transaminase